MKDAKNVYEIVFMYFVVPLSRPKLDQVGLKAFDNQKPAEIHAFRYLISVRYRSEIYDLYYLLLLSF